MKEQEFSKFKYRIQELTERQMLELSFALYNQLDNKLCEVERKYDKPRKSKR